MKEIKIGLIGLGTVGKGVYEAISSNGSLIAERTGVSLVIKGICDKDKSALDAIAGGKGLVKTENADDILNDKEIDIVVELIGGIDPAKDIILRALGGKKHVVTANKALLSMHWKDIFSTASKNKVFVNFEASVGGAIPIIRALQQSLVANKISTIYGILNGTTNFILSEMSRKGCSFDEALRIAQEKGLAEPDPELDISGKDSAHKLALLALLGFGIDVSPEDIYTEGITNIGPQDFKYASQWGRNIKLLAIAKEVPEGIQLRVHPTLFFSSRLLAGVKGADNAIFIKGDLMGDSFIFGKGAGSKPTSSSVVGDIVEIAKHVAYFNKSNLQPYNLDYAAGKKKVCSIEDLSIAYYLRFSVIDKPGVLAEISSILAKNNISIANVSQEERKEGETVPVIILTHKAEEGKLTSAISKIDTLDFITDKTVVIRMEE
jgi:homoserine dehydrogenase